MSRAVCLVLFALAGSASVAMADTLSTTSNLDNTMYEDVAGGLSNGQGPYLYAGKTSRGQLRRGLIAFDLSSIPAGSVVTNVSLTLFTDLASGTSTVQSLHRTLATWGEGQSNAGNPGGAGDVARTNDATWLHRFYDTQSWVTAGGDFASIASASKTVAATGPVTWSNGGLIADVQGWINGSTNAGWTILGAENSNGSAIRYYTRENADTTHLPTLVVTYTPAPAPAGAAVLGAGLLVTGRRRRR